MFGLKDLNKNDLLKIVAAVLASAAGWMVDNQGTVLTWTAVIVVWGVNRLFQWRGIQLGRKVLTAILLFLSVVLQAVFTPVSLPVAPVFAGDATAWVNAMIFWVGQLGAIAAALFTAATNLYNVLLKDVLDKIVYAPAAIAEG